MHQHGVKISEKTVLADRLLVVVINQTEQNETKRIEMNAVKI